MSSATSRPAVSVRGIREALGISRERIGRLLNLTSGTIARLERAGRLPSGVAAVTRLAQIQEVVELGLVVFTPDGFTRFMSAPAPSFRGLTPLQLIERGEAEQLFGALASLHEGNPS